MNDHVLELPCLTAKSLGRAVAPPIACVHADHPHGTTSRTFAGTEFRSTTPRTRGSPNFASDSQNSSEIGSGVQIRSPSSASEIHDTDRSAEIRRKAADGFHPDKAASSCSKSKLPTKRRDIDGVYRNLRENPETAQ